MRLVIPKLYVILDAALLREPAPSIATQLLQAGVRLFQYRAKNAPPRETLEISRRLTQAAREYGAEFFVNDRPDIAYLAGANGVHVGQDDLTVEQARALVGPHRWVGVSTHNRQQFERAALTSADYVAIGPVFATTSKTNPDPVVGTELLRQLRPLTQKPIVAIGGIRLENAPEVIQAGADAVAVISDILAASNPAERASQFLQRLDTARSAAIL